MNAAQEELELDQHQQQPPRFATSQTHFQPSLLNPGMTTQPTSGLSVLEPPSSHNRSAASSSSSSSHRDITVTGASASSSTPDDPIRNSTHAKIHDMSSLPHHHNASSSDHPSQNMISSLNSPCFVHSYLDKGVALGESLKKQRRQLSKARSNRPKTPRNKPILSDHTASADESTAVQTPGPTSAHGNSADSYFDPHSTGRELNSSAANPISVSKLQSRHEEDTFSGSDATATDANRALVRGRFRMPSSSEDDADDDDEGHAGFKSYPHSGRSSSYDGSEYTYSSGDEDDSDKVRSLTRQLAETAVGVREMSKQLGRARVKSTIQSVMIITKARDNHLIKLTRELAIWLMTTPRNGRDTGLIVYVDSQLKQSKRFDADGIKRDFPHLFDSRPKRTPSMSSSFSSASGHESNASGFNNRHEGGNQLRYWTSDMCSRSPHLFDFVVTLGGDGTVLFCSWLFQRIVPPVLPFALGSLGFLTNFDFKAYKEVMKSALDDGIRVNLRMRFTATVYRATLPSSSSVDRQKRQAIKSGKTGEIIINSIKNCGWDAIESPGNANPNNERPRSDLNPEEEKVAKEKAETKGTKSKKKCRDKEIMCFSTRPVETFEVLNDLVVDRGPSPYVSLLEVFGDEHHMTTAQADGLCISTPTGSTAYSLSAGGSLVHPEIPAILITPICPHTLSFRPMLLPDSMELRIAVPYNSRSTAWASFDGRGRVELKQGDHIKVTASRYPFPTVCAENQSTDWFSSISRTLKWNERQRQKSFVVVEEGAESSNGSGHGGKDKNANRMKSQTFAKHNRRYGDDDDDDSSDDESEDEEDGDGKGGDEDENEKFDIDDTSTTVTRSNSPSMRDDGLLRRRSVPGTPRLANGTSRRSAVPPLLSSSNGIPRLTSLSGAFSAPGGEGGGASGGDRGASSATSSKANSLLNSPDRFGLQGPPQPPKAISERHLLSADFRLDDGRSSQHPSSSSGPSSSQTVTRTGVSFDSDRASHRTPATPSSALARDVTPRPDRNNRESESRRRSDRTPSRKDSRGSESTSRRQGNANGGTALVVYGEDESDSDSTTGAGN